MTLVTLSKSIDYVFVARKTAYLWNSLIFRTGYQKKKNNNKKKIVWFVVFCLLPVMQGSLDSFHHLQLNGQKILLIVTKKLTVKSFSFNHNGGKSTVSRKMADILTLTVKSITLLTPCKSGMLSAFQWSALMPNLAHLGLSGVFQLETKREYAFFSENVNNVNNPNEV